MKTDAPPGPIVTLTVFEHLDELRKRLFISLAAVAAAAVAGYFYSDEALVILMRPAAGQIQEAFFFSPAEAFIVKMKIALFIGTFFALPVIASQAWLFVSPALYGREKKAVFPFVFVTFGLFLVGAAFAYFAVLPAALRFLIGLQTEVMRPMISVGAYVGFLTALLIAFGAAFNMPVFIMAFVLAGVVDAAALNRYHRQAVVLIFIAAAVLTPGPDIVSQLCLAVPLLGLFEITLLLALLVGRKRRKKAVA